MNIVREHDRTGPSFFQDSIAHDTWSRPLPIERVHIPDDNSITEIVMNPSLLTRGDGSVWWPQQSRVLPNGGEDRVIRFLQFTAHGFIGHFTQVRMRPGMVSNLMTLTDGAPQNVGVVRRVLAHHKKRRFHMMRREEIEQFRRDSRVRAVVECQGNVGSVDVNRIEGDLQLSWRGRGGWRKRGVAFFNRPCRWGVLPEHGVKNQEVDQGAREQLSDEHEMANARAENFPVYLAEGACNASQQADAILLTEPSAIHKEWEPWRFRRQINFWQSSCFGQ